MWCARACLIAVLVLPPVVAAQSAAPAQPARTAALAAARDVMQRAVYCTFVTIGESGHPHARIVEPTEPDANFTIWIGTNPLTRKVKEIERDPRVALLYFHAATSSYVTVLGRAEIVSDVDEKDRRWKQSWAPFYSSGPRGSDFMLLRVTPTRLEISSPSRKMDNDPKTWLPVVIDLP